MRRAAVIRRIFLAIQMIYDDSRFDRSCCAMKPFRHRLILIETRITKLISHQHIWFSRKSKFIGFALAHCFLQHKMVSLEISFCIASKIWQVFIRRWRVFFYRKVWSANTAKQYTKQPHSNTQYNDGFYFIRFCVLSCYGRSLSKRNGIACHLLLMIAPVWTYFTSESFETKGLSTIFDSFVHTYFPHG